MARGKTEGPVRTVTFTNPPEKRGRYDWSAISEELRAHPREWAMIFEKDKTSIANAVRYGFVGSMHPALGFEYRTANNVRYPERVCTLYARYDPDKADPLRDTVRQSRRKVE